MDTFQNSDFFFVVESFKIFFEKVLTAVSDPKGIAIQEWLKYKDKLTAKDATPSSIYCYAHQLVISEAQQGGDNMVKLKRQSSRRGSKKVNTPRKITRRNSFGSESPLSKTGDGIIPKDDGQGGQGVNPVNNPSNFSAATQPQAPNGGGFSDKMNQYSPWIDNDRKKNPSPAKRITTNEIQYMKGLDELSKIKDTKMSEQQLQTQKLLLEKVKKCIEQFTKDSTSLDLINDRSFQTQTMIIPESSKRKVFDRGIKRQDSKFIREFSIYKKNNPTIVQPNAVPGAKEPTSQFAKEFKKDQPEQFAPSAIKTPTPGIDTNPSAGANNVLLGFQIDYIKSKNTPGIGATDLYSTGGGYGSYGISTGLTNTGSIPNTGLVGTTAGTVPNYLGSTPSYQTTPGLYMPSHHQSSSAGGAAGLLGTTNTLSTGTTTTTTSANTASDDSKKGIDEIVQRILKEQKVKEEQDKLSQKKQEQDKILQDILSKHKQQSTPLQGTSYQTSTTTTTAATAGIPSYTPTTATAYQYSTSINSSNNVSPYLNSSPLTGYPSNTTTTTTTTSNQNYATQYGLSSLPSQK